MSPSPSRTIPPSFGQSLSKRQSWQRTRDDDSDDDDDNSSSTSTSHSRSPQSTHSQSSQHDGHNSSQVTPGTGTSRAGAIAGGVIAGIIVLAILAFFWWRRRSSRNRPNVKIEIDPMSTLSMCIVAFCSSALPLIMYNVPLIDGEAYTWKTSVRKAEEQLSLIHERSSTAGADSSPPPSQPQFWQVHNVDDVDDNMHDAPIPRSVPGVGNTPVVSNISIAKKPGEKSRNSTSTINLIPVPEKDFRDYRVENASASSSKTGPQSPYSSNDSTLKGTTEKDGYSKVKGSSTLHDSPGPSAWKEKEGLKQTYDSPVGDSGSQRSTRRFSESEANDLALAAREEVTDLRRRVELLKQENAELTRRNSGGSFERLPAYDE
ncbi:MAG: hypothetical protein NXY57DRAFT_1063588 [Lentinula lateritia]|uniref:Uncharacterized protein n=1 Tax=Lentinula lateritia TaxID=40482 RepID=A0ABQ8V934_9AGAR|nr:MAG: hypothetical protein NXY57DRAFT_1063588 [Lentinula lateritia]KAJ4479500.1 hypothetical protein C8R41DRAFT_869295 [Lentinula lateritia]